MVIDTDALLDQILGEEKYRANPRNWYHDEYQASINRQFLIVVVTMFAYAIYAQFGLIGLVVTAAWALFGSLGIVFALWVVLTVIFEVIPGIYNWIRGK